MRNEQVAPSEALKFSIMPTKYFKNSHSLLVAPTVAGTKFTTDGNKQTSEFIDNSVMPLSQFLADYSMTTISSLI